MKIIMLLMSLLGARAYADVSPKNAEIFCERLVQTKINFSEQDYTNYFDSSFISKISYQNLLGVFEDLQPELGNCESFTSVPVSNPGHYNLTLTTASGLEVHLALTVDEKTGLFTGLLRTVDNPAVKISSWQDAERVTRLLAGSGRIGATLKTDTTRLSFNDGEAFAMGSTFKLYVLGALHSSITKGQHAWGEQLAIRDDWKSLLSGGLYQSPVGTKLTLQEFATYMISISDNTAADHLLYFLGRENVEAMLAPMNNAHAKQNLPFLSTLEMFKLKWAINPLDTAKYISDDETTRRDVLTNLAKVDRFSVGKNGVSSASPVDIDTIEWFGTTDDTCNAILWLASQNSAEIRKVLSTSTGVVQGVGQPNSHWAYVGYKGGTEPGVLSMTYLLESKSGQRGCLSMSFNDTKNTAPTYHFRDVITKTLAFAETQIP